MLKDSNQKNPAHTRPIEINGHFLLCDCGYFCILPRFTPPLPYLKFLPSATKLRRLRFYRRVPVHTEEGCLPQCMLGYCTQEQTPPRSRHPPPGADTPPPGAETPPGRDGHCCGRYASYWMHSFPKCFH